MRRLAAALLLAAPLLAPAPASADTDPADPAEAPAENAPRRVEAPEAPRVRIATPTPRTLLVGPTRVCVEKRGAVDALRVYRELGPGRWQELTADASGAFTFDAGLDLGPETLRVLGYRRDEAGVLREVAEDRVTTALFPEPTAVVSPEPSVDVLVRAPRAPGAEAAAASRALEGPARETPPSSSRPTQPAPSELATPPAPRAPREPAEVPGRPASPPASLDLDPARFTCELGGEVCEVIDVEEARHAELRLSLLIDVSGSMCSYGRQLAEALNQLVGALSRESPGTRLSFRVVSFAEERRVQRADPIERGFDRARRLFSYESDLSAVREQIETIGCGGWTALYESIVRELYDIDLARDETSLAGGSVAYGVIVLSDGVDTIRLRERHRVLDRPGFSLSRFAGRGELMTLAAEVNVPVFPIGIGPETSLDFLRLGPQSGGRSFRGRVDVSSILAEIGEALASRRRVTFRPAEGQRLGSAPRPFELGYPGVGIDHPQLWSAPASRLARARTMLEEEDATLEELEPALEAVRELGEIDDAELVFERYREALFARAEQQNLRFDEDAALERLEAGLGLLASRQYLESRAQVFYAIFAPIARTLLHAPRGGREERDAAELVAGLEHFIRGERYSLEHVLGPTLEAYLDPDFPADEEARARLVGALGAPSAPACPRPFARGSSTRSALE